MQYDADAMFQSVAACAALGWKIVRLWGVRNDASCTCGRADCPTPGKHPAGGSGWQHRATDNEEEIARWFDAAREGENSRCNVGIRLGATSGVIDVEFDSPEAEEVLKSYGLHLIDTPAYSSGRGVHRLFQHEEWMPNSAVVKVNGLEVRIGGGEMASQSVIPPSWHKTAKQYMWLPGKSPEEVSPARLPDEFREAVLASSTKQGSGVIAQSRDALRADEKVGEGGRHAFLVGIASKHASRIRDFTDNERLELIEILLSVNDRKCNPPKGRSEIVKIATDQFAYYRDKKIERRARRPYEVYGLEWNAEDRCWEPGSWSMTVVHSDPRIYKLRIPNERDKSLPPYVITLDSKQFQNGSFASNRILEVTGRVNMNDPSPKRWATVWVGETERDENGNWTHVRGLSARLLEDSDDEYPPPEQRAMCSNLSILLAYLSDFAKVESADNDNPNASGLPKWLMRDGQWELWLQWHATVNAAWKRAGLQAPSVAEKNAILASIRHAMSPNEIRTVNHRLEGGRQLKCFVFREDVELATINRLSEG